MVLGTEVMVKGGHGTEVMVRRSWYKGHGTEIMVWRSLNRGNGTWYRGLGKGGHGTEVMVRRSWYGGHGTEVMVPTAVMVRLIIVTRSWTHGMELAVRRRGCLSEPQNRK